MKTRMESVQVLFWSVLGTSLALLLLAFPRGHDAANMKVLHEMRRFQVGFDQAQLETDLLEQAKAQGTVAVAQIAEQVVGVGVPNVTAGPNAGQLTPSANLDLATLAAVHALGAPGAEIEIAAPDSPAIASSVAWRLADRGAQVGHELISVSLTKSTATSEQFAREGKIWGARKELLAAREAAGKAQTLHEQMEELYRARVKWKAHWKHISRANAKRTEAGQALQVEQTRLASAQSAYTELASAAKAFKGKPSNRLGRFVEVSVELKPKDGAAFTMAVPAAISVRKVSVASLTGTQFAATRKAGLWDELKDGSAAQAIDKIRGRFSWHYQYVEVGGFKLGGMTLLSLGPLLLLILPWLMISRSRKVSGTYNPFDRPSDEQLPRVGLGSPIVDLIVLVVLPVAGSVMCAWSLTQTHQFAALPILSGLVAMGLGFWAHLELKQLRSLREAIVRTHTTPPQALSE